MSMSIHALPTHYSAHHVEPVGVNILSRDMLQSMTSKRIGLRQDKKQFTPDHQTLDMCVQLESQILRPCHWRQIKS